MPSSKLKTAFRPLVLWASILYLIVLCGVLYGLDHCTEAQWYFGALLYLPTEGWLLPLVVLLPLALLARPTVCLLHVAAVAAVYFGYQGPAPSIVAEASTDEATLTVITANIGQRKPRTLEKFLEEKDADIIAFQESRFPVKRLEKQHPDYFHKSEGEFTLVSRLPILESGVVPDLEFNGHPVAAWFELEYQGQAIVVYSVHMPTPRSYLQRLLGGGISTIVLSGGGFLNDDFRQEYQQYWATRFELAKGLMAVLDQEQRPILVVGDFNTPDHGGLYKMFATQLTDTFAVAGSGSGDTFPANSRGRMAEGGPWMRLDYLFAGKEWRPLASEVEPLTSAQHLAVMGKYALIVPGKEAAAKVETGEKLAVTP